MRRLRANLPNPNNIRNMALLDNAKTNQDNAHHDQ